MTKKANNNTQTEENIWSGDEIRYKVIDNQNPTEKTSENVVIHCYILLKAN